MTEPVFQAPEFDRIAAFPAECREKFMHLTTPGHRAPLWHVDRLLDDFNLWVAVYGE